MGDVLMTLPVIDAVARQHPDVRFTFVSRAWVKPLVQLLPPNVGFVSADLKGQHKGLMGLNRLSRRLMALHPTAVADLHDVIRSRWIDLRLRLTGVRVAIVDKGRRARRRFLRAEVKTRQRPVFERYADVFRRLGLDVSVDFTHLDTNGLLADSNLKAARPEPHWVGIAPFAAHNGKIYPAEMMEKVVASLSGRGDVRVFLFGAGAAESAMLEDWASRYEHVESVAGRMRDMSEELALISHLEVMLSMDSANMHLASLAAVPVVSVWGATHPFGGFLGYGQSLEDVVQLDGLDCRPCSIYGQKPCCKGDYPCLRDIRPEVIVGHIERHLTANTKAQ